MENNKEFVIQFNNGAIYDDTFNCSCKSLSDADIIDALMSQPDIDKFSGSSVKVWCEDPEYSSFFHVTRNVSYNITPF